MPPPQGPPHMPAAGDSLKPASQAPPPFLACAAKVEWSLWTWSLVHSGQAGSAARLESVSSSNRLWQESHSYSKIGMGVFYQGIGAWAMIQTP